MKSIVVFYHKNCLDGFTAAWAAWRKFGKNAVYIGIEAKSEPVKNLRNKEIYFLDACFEEKPLRRMVKNNKKVVVIDHHLSRKDFVHIATEAVFDLKRSGSALAWNYFHSERLMPKLVSYVEDNDLWRFRLPYARELNNSLETYPMTFEGWSKLAADFQFSGKRKKYIEEGRAIIKYKKKIAQELAKAGDEVFFENHRAIAVNSSILKSEIGEFVLQNKMAPLFILWHYEAKPKPKIYFSLRSNGKINVAELAKKFGGGGHRAAGGFNFELKKNFPGICFGEKLPWQRKSGRTEK
ncbi:hypothetical protein HYV91_03530 [Candidatus Wolfebacteria bacterium]|nr:hypothetical protein [Candidatus Wolfebacteria bacterium]